MSYNFIKRVLDFSLASLLLFFLFPVFLYISVLIKTDSEGEVFYLAERVGFKGKKFRMFKFRSMRSGSDKIGFSVPASDKKITKIGRILRKSKLDEIPELINVLKGEMSFVGPRPEVEFYVNKFNESEERILDVIPGMTDFSSIKFRNEAEVLERSKIEDKEKAFEIEIWPEKKRLQLEYVRKRGFWIDLKILFTTIKCIF